MNPEQVEKAAKEHANRCGFKEGDVGWFEASNNYKSGANLLKARVERLEDALKKIKEDAAIVHDDALYTLCDAALEGKEL